MGLILAPDLDADAMKIRMRKVLAITALPFALLVCTPAQAEQGQRQHSRHSQHHDPQRQPQRAPRLSASEAADRARSQAGGGRVLSVRQQGGGYQVKLLLLNGTIHVVHISGD